MLTEDSAPRPGPVIDLALTAGVDGTSVLAVAGEVDSLTAPDLRDALGAALAAPDCRRLVLDLSGVTFLSSAGMSVLLNAREDTRSRSVELRLIGLADNRAVRRPLEVTGMLGLFHPHPDGRDEGVPESD